MQNKLKWALLALFFAPPALAQTVKPQKQLNPIADESAFTFTDAQLGENDDMSQNVTILNSNNNLYASRVGFLFSPVRFRYRAFNQRYNDVYVNGALLNDMETGQFRFSQVGGLNQQMRDVDFLLPFEGGSFGMSGMAGSNNYDFRAGKQPTGHRAAVSAVNRNYTLRGVYSFGSGLSNRGWAFSGGVTYRWAKEGYVEGTFYNAFSYFLGIQKVWKNGHALSFTTWGNPTERGTQGAATDESYWIANDRQYNPYWGYQNGKKRNSRVVTEYAPSALLTWDWDINNDMKLVTTLTGKYSMYKSTKLNYNNTDNPQPDYYKMLPSNFYDVWDATNTIGRTEQALADWNKAFHFLSSSKANRQVNWDRLYEANRRVSTQGADAMYFIQAKHNDALTLTLASTLNKRLKKNAYWNLGIVLGTNSGRHYQTLEDLLGASTLHNLNYYAIGTYTANAAQVQYDWRRPNAVVREGDKFGYDYFLLVNKGYLWTTYAKTLNRFHTMVSARIGSTSIQREGKMCNGLYLNNSYGKSKAAWFGDAGAKAALTYNAGRGHTLFIGLGYQWNAPQVSVAFVAPEMNNDFVTHLKNERVLSSEAGYQYQNAWLHANLNAYYSRMNHVTEWQNFYFDDINSFSYVSLSGIEKEYYGVEVGAKVKLTSFLDLNLLGTWNEGKYANNADVNYINSTQGTYNTDVLMNKGMRESGTPLTAGNIGLSYHQSGWYIDLNANYYDRIYLSYSPYYRYKSILDRLGSIDENGQYIVSPQDKGHGGFMLDGSIGKNIRMKRGSLSINLMVVNLLNNQNIVTGGYEQSRSDYTASGNARSYKFSRNPKKFYAFGTNGMLNISYRF